MARQPKPWDSEDLLVLALIEQLVSESALSQREIARQSAMSQGRLRSLLASTHTPATVGEVARIAAVFGQTPIDFIRNAEALRGVAVDPTALNAKSKQGAKAQ